MHCAHERRYQGLPGLSINWGAWSEVGAAAERQVDKRVSAQGIGVITPQQGLAALELLMQGRSPQVGVLPVEWSTFLAKYGDAVPAWFAEVRPERTQRPTSQRKDSVVEIGQANARPSIAGAAG